MGQVVDREIGHVYLVIIVAFPHNEANGSQLEDEDVQLVTFTHCHQKKLGAVLGDFVVDLHAACALYRYDQDFPSDMLALLRAGDPVMQRAHTALEWVEANTVY